MSLETAERTATGPRNPTGSLKTKPRSTKDDKRVLAMPAGRPSKYSETVARHIVDQMSMGRTLLDICDHDSIAPNRSTVSRWIETRSEFAAAITRARRMLALDAEEKVSQLIEKTTQSTANADRVKMLGLQWLAKARDPSVYADKPMGVQVNVSLDALVAGSYALEEKARKAKPVDAKVTTKPLDTVAELTDNDRPQPE